MDTAQLHQVLAILYLLSFSGVILLTPPMRRLGFLIGAVDRPDNARKIHTRIIARFGGPAVFLAFFVAFALLPLVGGDVWEMFWERRLAFVGLLAGSGLVLGAGIFDDVKGLHGKYKFMLVMLAAVILWAAGFSVDRLYIPLPGWGDTELTWWVSLPLTVFWLTLCAAALNLIDGLDGLATGVTLIASITLLRLGWGDETRVWESMLLCSLIGSVIGFLIFNFHPAKIFLGDSGALFLGFMVGAISVKSSFKSTTLATLIVPIVVLGLPILDTSMVIISRWARHVSIFNPDRLHLHHRLMDQWGLSQRAAVFFFYAVAILFGGGALLLTFGRRQWQWLPVAGVGLLIVLLLALLRCQEVAVVATRLIRFVLIRKGPPRNWMERAYLFNALEQADSVSQVWHCTTEIMSEFQVHYGGLKLDPVVMGERTQGAQLSWEWNGAQEGKGDEGPGGARWSVIHELQAKGQKLGVFYLERAVVGGMSIEGLGEVVNKLTECLTKSLARLAASAPSVAPEAPAEP